MTLTDRLADLRKLAESMAEDHRHCGAPCRQTTLARAVLAMADVCRLAEKTEREVGPGPHDMRDALRALDRALAKEETR